MQLDESGLKDWHRIAKKLPGRSNKDCRKRWCNNVTEGLRKGPWDEEEDGRLEKGIRKHGYHWAVVAQEVETRSADQCAKRWTHCLDPALDRSEWTQDEDQQLMDAVEKHGHSWKDLQTKYYPGRSANSVKNRYTILTRKVPKTRASRSAPSPAQSAGATEASTPASYDENDFLQSLDDSGMPALDTTPSKGMQAHWMYPTMNTDPQAMYSQTSLGLTNGMQSSLFPPGNETLDDMSVDDHFDLGSAWPHESTINPQNTFFSNEPPSGTSAASSAFPPPSTGSYPSTRPPSSFGAMSRQPSLASTRNSTLSPATDISSKSASRSSASTSPSIIGGPDGVKSNLSSLDALMGEDQNEARRLTLTIEDPTSDTMADIMGILAKSKSKKKMKLEVN